MEKSAFTNFSSLTRLMEMLQKIRKCNYDRNDVLAPVRYKKRGNLIWDGNIVIFGMCFLIPSIDSVYLLLLPEKYDLWDQKLEQC